jgi:hypothetical protein
MVCFFDALRDAVKKHSKGSRGHPREFLGFDAPSNPVKKEGIYREMTIGETLKKIFPSGRRARIAA